MSVLPRILIRGGRVVDPAHDIDRIADLAVADGRIVAIGTQPDGFTADQQIDATQRIVCPGFVDLCARLRDPGSRFIANIASETPAAAASGITTLCCPPDTQPVIDSTAVANLIMEKAEQAGKARVLPIGALTRGLNGKELASLHALKKAGCVAVSNANAALANNLVLRRTLEYAASHDLLVMIRPEDADLRDNGCAHEGVVSGRLGLPGIPAAAETVAIAQTLALLESIGARVHFSQLSTAGAVRLIEFAQQTGLSVSADVAAHQLHLTEDELEGFEANAHVLPPLRASDDRDALRTGVRRGVIGAICSDHQPHDRDAKLNAFPATLPGMSTLETLLPLTLLMVAEAELDLPAALATITCEPARILGIDAGTLGVGKSADICIFDPEQEWRVDASNWLSSGRNTLFWEAILRGRVTHTLLGGRAVHRADANHQ